MGWHRIVEDDSGHSYVIPAELQQEFDEWIEYMELDEWDAAPWDGYDFDKCYINVHPSNILFTEYKIEGE